MKYSVRISNGKPHDSFMSNLKGVTIISAQVRGLLLFCNTSREGSVIYLILFDKHDNCWCIVLYLFFYECGSVVEKLAGSNGWLGGCRTSVILNAVLLCQMWCFLYEYYGWTFEGTMLQLYNLKLCCWHRILTLWLF